MAESYVWVETFFKKLLAVKLNKRQNILIQFFDLEKINCLLFCIPLSILIHF